MRQWCVRLAAAATAASFLVSGALAPVGGFEPVTAGALPTPAAPTSETVAEQWVNPMLRVGDTGAVKLTELAVTDHDVTGTVEALESLGTQAQIFLAPPVGDLPSAFNLLGLNPEAYPIPGPTFPVGQFHFTFAELGITEPGIHAVLLRVGEETTHFLITVSPSETDSSSEATSRSEAAGAVALLWPLAADIPLVPGETGTAPERPPLLLRDESLMAELRPGGRLARLLDLYPGGHACLAIDPQLVDVLSRMSDGYQVASTRPSPVEPTVRLRERWTAKKDTSSTPGQGAALAGEFLARLREVAKNRCVVALPWGGADLTAATRAGVLGEALDASVLEEELETPVAKNLVVPSSGYITPETAAALPQGTGAITGDGLTAQLATLGEHPETVGYTDPLTRFRYAVDSPAARRQSAAAAIQFARQTADPTTTPPPVVVPPRLLEAADAAMLAQVAKDPAQLTVPPYEPATPQVDPTGLTDVEITTAAQQLRYAADLKNLMVEDPNIAVTPEEFTAPLRHSIVESLSLYRRRSIDLHEQATSATRVKLDAGRDVLQQLRRSVTLLPPGNVYTRTSNSSPVVIVAQNGLPLPVEATIHAESEDATVALPGTLWIPAQGSITTQLTADVPKQKEQASIKLWLANDAGAAISEPVTITVQTKGSNWWVWLVAIVTALFFVVRLALRRRRH